MKRSANLVRKQERGASKEGGTKSSKAWLTPDERQSVQRWRKIAMRPPYRQDIESDDAASSARPRDDHYGNSKPNPVVGVVRLSIISHISSAPRHSVIAHDQRWTLPLRLVLGRCSLRGLHENPPIVASSCLSIDPIMLPQWAVLAVAPRCRVDSRSGSCVGGIGVRVIRRQRAFLSRCFRVGVGVSNTPTGPESTAVFRWSAKSLSAKTLGAAGAASGAVVLTTIAWRVRVPSAQSLSGTWVMSRRGAACRE